MMLAAFSFAFGMYAEKQNKTTKYVIYRTGIKRYVISKALLAFISSVFVMGIIAIICAIYIHGRFPSISEADSEFIEFKMQGSGYSDTGRKLNLVSQMGFGAAYLYGIFGMMLYGGLCASIGFIVYALTKDIYFNIDNKKFLFFCLICYIMMVRNNTIRRKTVLFPRFPQSRVLSEWREIIYPII